MTVRERFYDPRKRPEREALSDPGDTREQRRAVATFVFGIGCFILIAAVSFWQATSERASFDILRGAVIATTELDLLIAEHWDELRTAAEEEPDERFVIEGYPIVVEFTGQEILAMTPEEMRERVLNRTAADVYFEGLDTFAGGGESDIGLLSVEGIVQQIIDIYGPGVHRAAGIVALIAFVVTVLAAAVLALVSQTFSTLRTAGMAAGFAALVGLAMVFIIGFAMQTIAGSDPLYEDFADLFGTSLNVPQRNFAVLLGLGVGLWVLGLAGGLLNRFALGGRPAPAASTESASPAMAPGPGATVVPGPGTPAKAGPSSETRAEDAPAAAKPGETPPAGAAASPPGQKDAEQPASAAGKDETKQGNTKESPGGAATAGAPESEKDATAPADPAGAKSNDAQAPRPDTASS